MDARTKRLIKEISDCEKDQKAGITVQPVSDGDVSHLRGSFRGPEGTPYEGGLFEVDIQTPQIYPFQPLKMKLLTKCYHPNISSQTGAICLDILKDAWSPVLTIKTALVSLQSLLCTPEPSDPQDAEVARHYLSDRKGFESTARYWTEVYARDPSSSASQATSRTTAAIDQAQLSGLDAAHVTRFTDMGFERPRVVEVLKRLNYRGDNARKVSDDDVVAALL